MAPVTVDPARVHAFADAAAFEDWLARHHDSAPEVWIRIFKVGSGLPTVTPVQAIDVALCWGWIDAIRKGLDATSFLQRYTPRRAKSVWSAINVANVERLIAAGRMTEHGLRHVEAARADGRWDRAYRVRGSVLPDDLQAAIDAEPEAKAALARLGAQERFALAFRTSGMKSAAGRRRKVAEFVAMLKRGEAPTRG